MRYDFYYRLLSIAACILSTTLAGAQPSPLPMPPSDHTTIVVSHRGDHTQTPENTLAAFANAIKAGADYVEIDLRTTVDSQLVIMHDASVDRMTNGSGLVKNMTGQALQALKVKDKKHPEWGEYDIPTFDQVLELCKNRIHIYLDFKNADPAVAFKEIVRYGMQQQVIVYINAPQQFIQWRSVAPNMPLMVSLPDTIKDTVALVTFLNRVHPDILDGDYDQYSDDMVNTAKRLGYTVLPDIQGPGENPALWATVLKKGFAGLQTDHPGALVAYLQQQHLR